MASRTGRASAAGAPAPAPSGEEEPWELGPTQPDANGDQVHAIDPVEADAVRYQVAQDILNHQQGGRRGPSPRGCCAGPGRRSSPRSPGAASCAATRYAVAESSGKIDYTFARMSRRQYPDIRLPSMIERWPNITVVLDTSGSMDDQRTAQATAEVGSVLRSLGGRHHLRVLSVDAAVHTSQRVFSLREVQLVGGGGTDLRVGIAAAEALRPRTDLLIVITDADTPWPDTKPAIAKVIVVNVGDGSPPDWPCRHIKVTPGRSAP